MFEPLTCGQIITGFGHFGRQVCCGDSNARVWVGDVVFEFFSPVHGIDWDHHCVGAQDREMRDHQLRAILHIEHNAVTFLNAHTL